MNSTPFTALAVDDDITQLELVRLAISEVEEAEVRLLTAETVAEAIRQLQKEPVELLLTDKMLPDGLGTHLLEHVIALNPEVPVVVMTAHEDVREAVDLMHRGARDYLVKPVKAAEIQRIVSRAIVERREQQERQEILEQLEEGEELAASFRTRNKQMRELLSLVARAAESGATVLIEGESGTGKELVARLLHRVSRRRELPLVAVNCAALPETLIESELFGVKKGAYTGATEDREGRFGAAAGGTLFIDEVGEIPLSTQVKLLRAIQSREFQPVGSSESRPLQARIIAATNRNLEQMVEEGSFREDLYYRLQVIHLRIPPLRSRKEDLPLLIDYFLERFAESNGKEMRGISKTAREALMRHEYPGNVRELENALERAIVLARGSVVQLADLPARFRDLGQTGELFDDDSDYGSLDLELRNLERRLIRNALDRAGGNQSEAARDLGVSERRLRSRLDRLGLR